ncbi:MAG: hypothetical protein JO069_10600 [Verrucomicrobia bacterium]|nr:hypothetical protein [Verrucomicrobiota bacterium]
MEKLLILLISLIPISNIKAIDAISALTVMGFPVNVSSSSTSYKVFEQYPWEGHASRYGPKGNRLHFNYGVGVGKNISRSLHLRYGDWIHMPEIGWRQVNEFSSKANGIEFFASHTDEYKGKHPRVTIDMVVFALATPAR